MRFHLVPVILSSRSSIIINIADDYYIIITGLSTSRVFYVTVVPGTQNISERYKMTVLHVSAGGINSRIKQYLDERCDGIPKHLLPIPGRENSLLEEILFQGETFFDHIRVWSNEYNILDFAGLVPNHHTTQFTVDRKMSGPLGPVIRYLLGRKQRAFGCAGDYYCEFLWQDMVAFHESHKQPVTILTARSAPFPNAATFTRQAEGKIDSWVRKDQSTEDDLVNVGCYIFDPDPALMRILRELERHKEDPTFDALIEHGMLAGYVPECPGFNVNTEETYGSLRKYLTCSS